MRGKGEGGLSRVPADPNQPLKYWQGVVELPPIDGRKRHRKYVRSKNKREAIRKLKEAQEELRRKGTLRTDNINVQEWFAYWVENYAAPNLRPATLSSYRSTIRSQIVPSLGEKTRIDKVTPALVQRLRRDILAAGRSSTYARNAHHILAASLTDAAGEGRIPSNPTEYVTPPRKTNRTLDVMSLEEAVALIGAIQHRPDRARWATSLLTGARRGEVIGIEQDRVGDVLDLSWQLQRILWAHGCTPTPDQDGRYLCGFKRAASCPEKHLNVPADHEYRHIEGGLYFTRPKSRAGWRIIPLVSPLRETLEAHIAEHPPGQHGLIFTTPAGAPRDPDWDSKQWIQLMRATFGDDRGIRLHDVRHTTVDLLYAAGVPEDVISALVGHSTIAMTRAYQSRGDRARLVNAMEQLSALLTPERTPEIGA
ncbi:tyrosine-type recombinase/integrase [Microbacterium telephonicum]|uniref:Phage integrase family protein n=1 Tax=Microbacterium telephonicum TaxID=1714841 RepID=A0A498BVN4_9MICO|nr:site-specific integrase [Microbacterium telephonicum]RLK47655.1 phage integrase family protein [Microbacterium telephonicum]